MGMFKILRHQRNANKKYLRYNLKPVRMAEINNTMTAYSGEDMEQEEHFSIVCGSAKLVNHSENQYGNSSTNQELFFLNTQLYLTWANTQRQSIIH